MRYYRRNRNADRSARRVLFRILFVIIAAVIVAVGATVLGNHVKKKVEEAERKFELAQTDGEAGEKTPSINHFDTGIPKEDVSVFAMGVDPLADAEEYTAVLEAMKGTYDTVSVQIRDENGTLIYFSPAALSFLRLPENEAAAADYERMAAFGSLVKRENFRMSAVMSPYTSEGALLSEADKLLITELVELGFDEVIITGIDSLTEEETAYLTSLSTDMISVGVLLTVDALLDERNERYLRILSASGIFFCVDLETEDARNVASAVRVKCSDLRNHISSYNLRFLLETEDPEHARTVYNGLVAAKVSNIQFTAPFRAEEFPTANRAEADTDETSAESTSPETGVGRNPYAVTSPETEKTWDEWSAEPEKETDGIYRGDGWY